jgi:non-homologous end joining protein Ku
MNIKAIGRGPVRSYQADGPGVLVWDEVRVPPTSERAKIRLHQIHRKTGNRIRCCKRDTVTGQELVPDDVMMAYEIGKRRCVEITDKELAANHDERAHLQHEVLSIRCRSMSMLGRSLMVWS